MTKNVDIGVRHEAGISAHSMGLTREKAKALRMAGDANNISTVFRVFVLNCDIFCGGTINCILDIKRPERR